MLQRPWIKGAEGHFPQTFKQADLFLQPEESPAAGREIECRAPTMCGDLEQAQPAKGTLHFHTIGKTCGLEKRPMAIYTMLFF